MESSEHNWTNISETISPEMLVFGEKASWMFLMNILINPITSKINIFMMSHFRTIEYSTYPCMGEKWGGRLTKNLTLYRAVTKGQGLGTSLDYHEHNPWLL